MNMTFNTTGTKTCTSSSSFVLYNPDEIKYGRSIYIVAFIITVVLNIPSALLNILLLKSMYSSLAFKKPSTLLLYNLSVSDLLIAMILLPAHSVKKVEELSYDSKLFCGTATFTYTVGFILSGVSLFTVTAISIDRYLIVHKGTHYPEKVTKRRVAFLVGMIWVLSFTLSPFQFVSGTRNLTYKIAGSVLAVCVIVTTASYCKMLWTLRNMKVEVSQLSESTNELSSIAKYRKTSLTMLIVFVVFICCYLPYMCAVVAIEVLGISYPGLGSGEALVTIITYMRSSLNPIILLCRIREIQKASSVILRNCFFKIRTFR